jgi:uncharacterized protein
VTTATVLPPAADPAERIHHTIATSVVLHLAPGVMMLVVYLFLAPVVIAWGYPPLFASLLSIPLILVPWMLGYLSFIAYRTEGTYNPLAAVGYRTVLPRWQYVAYTAGLTAVGAVAFVASDAIIGNALVDSLFSRLPAWFLNPADLDTISAMAVGQQIVFLTTLLVFAGFVAPVVEELYFRGFLLPGLARFGFWAPVISVALFTLYHFESPWEGPARFLMVLPMVFAVWYTRSVRIGIMVHVVLNTLSALSVIAAVAMAQ